MQLTDGLYDSFFEPDENNVAIFGDSGNANPLTPSNDQVTTTIDWAMFYLRYPTQGGTGSSGGISDFVAFDGSGTVIDHSLTAPVPEPATMFLLGSGLVGLAGFRRKAKRA